MKNGFANNKIKKENDILENRLTKYHIRFKERFNKYKKEDVCFFEQRVGKQLIKQKPKNEKNDVFNLPIIYW